MDLNKVTLQEPLQFIVDPKLPNQERLGIGIKEVTRDGKMERLHTFDCNNGSYLGFHDRNVETGISARGESYSYKGQTENGEHKYYLRVREGLYQKGKKKVVSEDDLPSIAINESVVSLQNGDKLKPLEGSETSLERLQAEAGVKEKTVAEKYGRRDGSLKDDLSGREESKADGSDEPDEPTNPEERLPQRY